MKTYPALWNSTSLTRDPVSAFIATAITGAEAGALFNVVQFLAGMGVSAVVNYLLTNVLGDSQGGGGSSNSHLKLRIDSVAEFDFAYGRVRKSGTVIYRETTGSKNQFHHMIIALAGHEIDAIESIYINDKIVTLDANGFVTSNPWDSKIRVKRYLGTATQTTDPDLLAETSNITSAFRGRGIAYLYVRLEKDRDVFTNGIPRISAIIRGKKVYDPRTAVTAYSNNWALCVRDYLTVNFGLNDSASRIDETVFAAEANVCDEAVTLNGGGTQARYTMDGVIRSTEPVGSVLKRMMTAAVGTLYWGGGKWKVKAARYSAIVKTLTYKDIVGPISIKTRHSSRDNFNTVRGVFVDESDDWIEDNYPELKSATFVTEDGGSEKPVQYDLTFTTNVRRAQRLSKLMLFRHREQMTVTLPVNISHIDLEVGDTVALTLANYGWAAKTFEVNGWEFALTENNAIAINLVLRETSAAANSWTANEKALIKNNTTLATYLDGLTVTGLTTNNTVRVVKDGTVQADCEVTWNSAASEFVDHYNVRWKRNTATRWRRTVTDDTSVELESLALNIAHTVEIQAVTSQGNRGAWASVGFTAGDDGIAPAVPSSVVLSPDQRSIAIEWSNPADTDLKHVEVWENTSNNSGTATRVARIDGDRFVRRGLGKNVMRWYFLRSVDFTGNISAFTAGQSATTNVGLPAADIDGQITTTQIEDGAVTPRKNAIWDQSNICPDPDFEDGNWTLLDATIEASTAGWHNENRVRLSAAATSYAKSLSKLYRVFPGEKLLVRAQAQVVTGTGGLVGTQIAFYDNKALANPVYVTVDSSTSTSITPHRGIVTVPAGKRFAVINGYKNNANITVALWGSPVIRRAADEDLLDDNAVTNAKIATNAVTETKIDNNAITLNKIAAASIDASKFISGLEPIEVVTTLPTTGNFNGRVAVLTTDSKLYRHNGTTWVSAVPATDITGTLTNAQIADLAATKVTGQITTTQITDSAVTSAKVAAGAIVAGKIAAGAIVANDIAAATITGAKIAATTITSGLLAANSVIAGKIAANAVTTATIAAGAITTDRLAANSVVASRMAITDLTNLVADANFDNWTTDWTISGTTATRLASPTTAWGCKQILRFNGAATSYIIANSKLFPVIPGEKFRLSAQMQVLAGAGLLYCDMLCYDNEAGANPLTAGAVSSGAAIVTPVGVECTVPAGKRFARVRLYKGNAGITDGYVGAPMLRRMASGELIVDGGITASKMATGSIATKEIIVNGVVSRTIVGKPTANVTIPTGPATVIMTKTFVAGYFTDSSDTPSNDLFQPVEVRGSININGGASPPWTKGFSVFVEKLVSGIWSVESSYSFLLPDQTPTTVSFNCLFDALTESQLTGIRIRCSKSTTNFCEVVAAKSYFAATQLNR